MYTCWRHNASLYLYQWIDGCGKVTMASTMVAVWHVLDGTRLQVIEHLLYKFIWNIAFFPQHQIHSVPQLAPTLQPAYNIRQSNRSCTCKTLDSLHFVRYMRIMYEFIRVCVWLCVCTLFNTNLDFSGFSNFNRICVSNPTNNSSTLWFMPTDVSINLQSYAVAVVFPSAD